ncbi:lipid-A-disaccharide synthase [Leptospira kanakyensis]|uniref:Lipid-A-disaccharide synthase n=1 Tax=Leptospira kanakyensis TaxID=2484968 RepID=A0A6N4QEJ7_9LEPT|nr:lipid-A-disaccharide synthase [Leptospira kanakyensis]TGK51962.1 lipid-A-disaccharide synthase [Leptospira kanakyensis]TGK57130.1 lipid-A-disaccharide synthase [Leptospira kanakyensis]TGK71854.1 lipid-A-disaccharide synthase [Leptospira kanakyensis]
MVTKKKSHNYESDKNILVIAGEHSGDLLGADLLQELSILEPEYKFYGIGGEGMIGHGLESMEELEQLSVIGFSEALKKYSFLKKIFYRVLEETSRRPTKLAILIDYPGFNLRLAKELKQRGIPSVFYVSPQIWAWKFNRIYFIKEQIALMLTLFRFEEEIYTEYGVNAKFVGHPITKRIPEKLKKEPVITEKLPDSHHGYSVGLLPGSRKGEIRRLIDPILGTAALLHEKCKLEKKKIVFLLPNINAKEESFILEKIEALKQVHPDIQIHYLWNASLRVMETSDLLLIASGTATLEGLYFETPMVILYKVSLFTYLLGSLLMRSKFIGLANILSGEEVCREITQNECQPKYIFEEAWKILSNAKLRNKMKGILRDAKERELGTTNASKKAAKEIQSLLRSLSN